LNPNLTIVEAISAKQMEEFVKFPFKIYNNNAYWTPPIIADEIKSFDKKNDIFQSVDCHFYLAYQNNEVVGRIAAIINWTEVNEQKKPKVRFGWFDVIDDVEVSRALLDKVAEFGRANKLEFMEGPVGFSNMDKAGMLTFGFEEMPTMIGLYNHEYYVTHLNTLGFQPEAKWVEFKIETQNLFTLEEIERITAMVEKRYTIRALKFNSIKEVVPYVDEMFALLNKTYANLQSFVPIQQFQIEHYKNKYIKFIHHDFISIIVDKDGKMIAFAITMPSFSRAFQKTKGKLFPFGFLHLLKAIKKNNHAEFYLIGIDPDYQSKGVNSLIFRDLYKAYVKRGITTMETNPLLEENSKVQLLWKNFKPILHKRRATFRKDL